MNENELFVVFPSKEEKFAFMKWFENGDALYQYNNQAGINKLTYLSSCDYGMPESDKDYGESGFMEFE